MNNHHKLFSLTALSIIIAGFSHIMANDSLWVKFTNPSNESRTKVWWFHGETATTEEGIDADLAAFKEKGVGGVVFYDQVHGKGEGAFPSMSADWWNALKHAALKAKELGLTFEVAASNGYVTGGPWITPQLAMKQTEFFDTVIHVAHRMEIKVPLKKPSRNFVDIATVVFPSQPCHGTITIGTPEIKLSENDTIIYLELPSLTAVNGISYTLSARGKGSTGSMNIPGHPQQRYFGAGYIDYPPIGELETSTDGVTWVKAVELLPMENNIGNKSRRRTISFPEVSGNRFRLSLHDWKGDDDRYKSISLSNVTLYTHDIVDNLETQSGLRTEVTYPHQCGGNKGAIDRNSIIDATRMMNDSVLSIELDSGDWHVVRFGYRPTGAKAKHGRKNLLGLEADVMSAEAANVHFDNYFKPICDTLACIGAKPTGMCMDSHEAGTQNWTYGFEDTISNACGYNITDWIPAFAGYIVDSRESTDRFFLDFRKLIGKTIADNYYGTFAKRCSDEGVDFTSQAMLNINNDNIASRGKADKPQGEFWAYQKNGNYDCLDAASAAHLYGHPIASAEAFTDTPYDTSWDELLRIANIAYCRGINEFVVCASSYQPMIDVKYDDSQSLHPYIFHRLNPDWETSGHFWDYQARCTQMLREGSPVIDLAVYIGEDTPTKTFAYKLPDIPEGYNFDVVNHDALINLISVKDGKITVTGGQSYNALIVPGRTFLSSAASKKIAELENNGAIIVRCPQSELPADDESEIINNRLNDCGIAPDLNIASANEPDDKILFFHRQTPDTDIYFVYNHSSHPTMQWLNPRSSHNDVEVWHPATMSREKADVDNQGNLNLQLQPYESAFIVMTK